MTNTPLTNHALALCVRDEEIQVEQMEMKMHPLYDHARRMERDRTELLRLLKMTVDCLEDQLLYGQPYNLLEAKAAIAKMERSE